MRIVLTYITRIFVAGIWLDFIANHCHIIATEKIPKSFSSKNIKIINHILIIIFLVMRAFSSQPLFFA
jgi:hypothetical protein